MIVGLIVSPEENTDGKAGRIIKFLPDSVQASWQRAMDKRSQQEQKEREESERKQKELQARNRKFYDEAILITQGKIPMPPELAPLYNSTSIELNILQDFLMRKAGVSA
jgi:alkylated DNA nucleotide flippase Atl1